MINILIIGKKSFIGQNVKKYLSNYFKVSNFSFEYVLAKKNIGVVNTFMTTISMIIKY